jgi:predicted Zn-dependent protease
MSDLIDDESSTYYREGRALLESGDVQGAIAKLEVSIAQSPHFKSLELLGEALLRIGDPQRAIVPLAAATTLNSQVRAPSLLAEALLATGERLKAHEIAKLALARDGKNKKAREVFDATADEYKAWSSQS